MVERQLTNDELFLCSCLNSPIPYFNVILPRIDRNVELSRIYQDNMLLDQNCDSVQRCGRGVGKTTTLKSVLMQDALLNPNKSGLLTTPSKAHLDPLFTALINFIAADPIYRNFAVRVIRSPEYLIEFNNGYTLYGRIAGTSGGKGVLSLHVNFLYVDESQLYTGSALSELQGCIIPGAVIKCYGVPNGLRDSFLSIQWNSNDIPEFRKHKITRLQDPTFTEKERQRLIKIYGGESSPGYRNQVLGEDDIIQHSTFSSKYYLPSFIDLPNYYVCNINGNDINEDDINDELELPVIEDDYKYALCCDIGYNPDPSIYLLFENIQGQIWRLSCKFKFDSVRFTKQAKIIDYILRQCRISIVAIDAGGVGRSVVLDLASDSDFPDKPYRVIPVDFQGTVKLGEEIDSNDNVKEITSRIKSHSTILIESMFQKKILQLPKENDNSEIFNEIQSSTKTKLKDGTYVYQGVDHNLSAIRCFAIYPLLIENNKIEYNDGPVIAYMGVEDND